MIKYTVMEQSPIGILNNTVIAADHIDDIHYLIIIEVLLSPAAICRALHFNNLATLRMLVEKIMGAYITQRNIAMRQH